MPIERRYVCAHQFDWISYCFFSIHSFNVSIIHATHTHSVYTIHINIQSGAKENKYFSWFAAAAITAKELSLNISYEEFANNTQKKREKKKQLIPKDGRFSVIKSMQTKIRTKIYNNSFVAVKQISHLV